MPKMSVRARQNGGGRKPKQHNAHPDRTEHRLRAQREVIDAKLARIEAEKRAAKAPATQQASRKRPAAGPSEEEEEAEVTKDYGDQRVVIKFFYEMLGSPPSEDWKGYHGTISLIRSRFGEGAPKPDTVERTLHRLAGGDEDIASKPHAGGAKPALSHEEDLLVGLMACEGFSQESALLHLNLDRAQQGLEPVSLRTIQRAEQRVMLLRRKRRSRKAGDVDLDSEWAKCSKALCEQFVRQFEAGAARQGVAPAPRPPPPAAAPAAAPPAAAMDGPTLDVDGVQVPTCTDPWGAIGEQFIVNGNGMGGDWRGWQGMCEIKGYISAEIWSCSGRTGRWWYNSHRVRTPGDGRRKKSCRRPSCSGSRSPIAPSSMPP